MAQDEKLRSKLEDKLHVYGKRISKEVKDKLSGIGLEQEVAAIKYSTFGWDRKSLVMCGPHDGEIGMHRKMDVQSVVIDPSGQRAYVLETQPIESYHNQVTLRPWVTPFDLAESKELRSHRAKALIEYERIEPKYMGTRLDVGNRQEPFFLYWGPPRTHGEMEFRQLSIISAIDPAGYVRQLAGCARFPDRTIEGLVNVVVTATEMGKFVHDGRASVEAAAAYDPLDKDIIRARSQELAASKVNKDKYELPADVFENISLSAIGIKDDGAFPRYRVKMAFDGRVAHAERIPHSQDYTPAINSQKA